MNGSYELPVEEGFEDEEEERAGPPVSEPVQAAM